MSYKTSYKTRVAWVEIAGKVFVEEDEILEHLAELCPQKVHRGVEDEDPEWIDGSSEEEKRQALREVASDKLDALFGVSDDPLKICHESIKVYE